MTGINEIKRAALLLGACGMIKGAASIKEAVGLLQTPQGREFALKTGFPSLELWREHGVEVKDMVFLDRGRVSVSGRDAIAIGRTRMEASFSSPDKLYHIIAMHGATVEITASNYAVVSVTSINSTVRVKNDGTAIINIEQK